MPKSNLTEIIAIIDKSGSMWGLAGDAIGGFNQFIEGQRKESGDANVSIILFDSNVYTLANSVDIQSVTLLDDSNYRPGGGTALYNAIGNAIYSTKGRVDALPEEEKPERFIFAILTDGADNASDEYTRLDIQSVISHNTDVNGWQFIFLAANIDAKETAKLIGIDAKFAMEFNASGQGVSESYTTLSRSVSMYRSGEKMLDLSELSNKDK